MVSGWKVYWYSPQFLDKNMTLTAFILAVNCLSYSDLNTVTMKEIQLTQGQVAIVDDEDYEWLNQYKWCASYDSKANRFYAYGWVNNKRVAMHRFIMQVTDSKIDVDHRFHNTLDNRKSELRVCTTAQNGANSRKPNRESTSRFKGVSWCSGKRVKCWQAGLMVNGKTISIGRFQTEEAAAYAWNQEAIKRQGEFACLNTLSDQEISIALSHPSKKVKTSKFIGVSFRKDNNKWRAEIKINKKSYRLGLFTTEQEASQAYNQRLLEVQPPI